MKMGMIDNSPFLHYRKSETLPKGDIYDEDCIIVLGSLATTEGHGLLYSIHHRYVQSFVSIGKSRTNH